jgi:hypothetical protein
MYGFTSRSRIFHLYGDITIAGEGQENLGLCSRIDSVALKIWRNAIRGHVLVTSDDVRFCQSYTILNEIFINIHTELKTRLSSVASIAMMAEKEASVTLST